jgi:tRNA(Ile)-lysidine synthase
VSTLKARNSAPPGARWLLATLRGQLGGLKGRRLCLAYSGGADSTALLALLAKARARGGFELRAVHVNHQLQAGAAGWARAARERAAQLDVQYKVLRIDVAALRGESPEAAARTARYRALAAQMQAGEVLLTAHHLEDQAETLLLQLLRGAGLAGLAAMPACSTWAGGTLLRPLLGQPRAALRAWLARQKLSWVEDPSNADLRYDRNYLRHEVLPGVLARWPAAARTLARAAAHLAEADALLADQLRPLLDRARAGRALQVSALRAHRLPMRRQLLRLWLQELRLPPADEARLKEMAGPMLGARQDAQPEVRWHGVRAWRHAGRLHAEPAVAAASGGAIVAAVSVAAGGAASPPAVVAWRWRTSPVLALSDGSVLELRRDAHGDVALSALPSVLHVGLRGADGGADAGAVKKLLQELRVVPRLRGRVPLIRDGAELVAIADLWVAPRLKAVPPGIHRGIDHEARGSALSSAKRARSDRARFPRGRFHWRAVPD